MAGSLRFQYPETYYHLTSRENERKDNPFKNITANTILGMKLFIAIFAVNSGRSISEMNE